MSETPLLLMTPGPTRVPERVLRAGARAMIHHRTPEFSREFATVLELLPPLFGTTSLPLPVHTTGRGALEAALCNVFSTGDEIVMAGNGKFGEMWQRIARSHGLVVHGIASDWERPLEPSEIEESLERHPRARGVTFAYGETSTGGANDVAALARAARARKPDVLVLVDGVSSIGGMPFAFDDWDVDVAVVATQKCLMSAPGLSFAVMSDRAWKANPGARLPHEYWDFAAARLEASKAKPETPGTPPVHIMLQVAEALRMIQEEGVAAVWQRHADMAAAVCRAVTRLGLTLQCPALPQRSTTVTTIRLPAHVAPQRVRDGIKAQDILTAAGLGPYAADCMRIGHMGDIRMPDVERTLSALAAVLAELGAA